MHMTRIAVLLPAVLMVVSGCASRDWVRDLMGKKEAEIGVRMDGLGNQIKTTDANLGETTKLARGAGERADGAQTALVGVVKELEANPTLVVKLDGFTDPKGTKSYNYTLAQRRVEAVRRFLADKGVQLSRVQAIGMGPLDDRGIPDEKKRRVTVTLMVDSD